MHAQRTARLPLAAAAAILAGGCLLTAPAARAQTTIFSDDFNAEPVAVPTSTLTKWNITVGNVDVIGSSSNGTSFDFYPGNGAYLDMAGSTGGSITTKTSFALTPGAYTLSFDLGKNGSAPETMLVSVGSLFSTTVSDAPNGGSLPNLVTNSFNFNVASATNATITFDNSADLDVQGWVLDNVKLVQIRGASAAPEPGALALAMAGAVPGAGLLLAAARRRRAA